MASESVAEWVLKHDRLVVLACLLAVITLAWSYIVAGAGMDMSRMSVTSGLMSQTWTPLYSLLMFFYVVCHDASKRISNDPAFFCYQQEE